MRYRDEELLAELGWLRRLARSLVGPGGSEEDLVQEAWLAAQRVRGGVSRAWLVRTLRNLAASWHRGESRLRSRERAVARPEPVEPEALLERSDTLGVVLRELRHLEEPYRTALLLLYQEGLSVSEAAVRLEVPVDTFRWRHREGLERLRRRLDGERADWRAALLPLFPGPSTNPLTSPAAASGGAGTSGLLGGIAMTWKTAVTVVAVAAIAFYSWTGDFGGPSQPASLPLPLEDVEEQQTIARLPEPEVEGARTVLEVPLAPPVDSGAGARANVADDADGNWIAIEVRDERGESVVGATVWLGTSPDPEGLSWTTDERGVADVDLTASASPEELARVNSRLGCSFYVRARTASRFGRTWVHSRDNGGEGWVRITPDADLRVQVVDDSGRPLEGVPVAKLRHRPGRLMFDRSTMARTDADGVAVLRHILDPLHFDQGQVEFQVGPMVLLRERADVTVSRAEIPSEPVVATLPPTASLVLEVRDSRGALQQAADTIRLVVDPSPRAERSSRDLVKVAGRSPLGVVEVPVVDGVAQVSHVGVELALLAHAPDADPMDSTIAFGAALPRSDGSRTLTLEPLETAHAFSGVALEDSGTPLANRLVQGKVFLHRGMSFEHQEFEFLTDSAGRFSFPISKVLCEKWAEMEGRELELWSEGDAPFVRHAIELELPEGLLRGEDDLGSVSFRTDRPWLAGRAVDAQGESVDLEGARLVVLTPMGEKSFRALRNHDPLLVGDQFAFLGEPAQLDRSAGETLELWCYAARQPDASSSVAVGQLDRRVEFPLAGKLRGRMKAAEGDSPENYYVRFVTGQEREVRNVPSRYPFAENGKFEMAGLSAVSGQLEVRTNRLDRLVLIVPGVVPGSESEEQRERLNAIALNAPLSGFFLRVVDLDGNSVERAELSLPRQFREESAGEGFFSVYLAEPTLSGTVSAPGFQAQEVMLAPGDRTVTLVPGPEVALWLSDATELPRGAELRVKLVRLEGERRMEACPLTAVEGGGYEGSVSQAGRYLVSGQLFLDDLALGELPVSEVPSSVLDIEPELDGQEFEVPFDRAAFEALIPVE